MTMPTIRAENAYALAFRQLEQRADEPAWLRELRAQSFARFEQTGFPAVSDEDWKYTNVNQIAKSNFAPALSSNGTLLAKDNRLASFIYEEARQSNLIFLNGIFRPDLSSVGALSEGVVALELGAALKSEEHELRIRRQLERASSVGDSGFAALNTALFAGGLFLKIPRGCVVESPIHLAFISETAAAAPAAFPRVLIVAEENSSATLIESYVSSSEGVYLTNSLIELVLEDNARLQHYKVQRESTDAFHVAKTRADLGANASYDTTTINFGAALSRHDIDVLMDHSGAECAVDGLYMVDGAQHTDTHSLIDHRQPNCTSHQLYKGILDGKSRAVFNGKVFVRHGAQQTDARQTNKNLLLSNEAQVDTKPQLEIFADDVKCTHGAAVGQLDEDEMFYLSSRGLSPVLARNLLTYGFAEEVIDKIKIDSIKRELDEAVLHRLHSDFGIE
jgi:Fe-S cluster assembly protein SufD